MTDDYKIVLISGKQGSGKTTLQKSLKEKWLQGPVFTINFADVLYEMHDAVLFILEKYLPKRDIEKDGPLLQLLGTEWGRKTISQDIWVKILQKKIEIETERRCRGTCLFLIGDCRFENELYAFPEALRVRLEADRDVRKARCSMWRENESHPSETSLDLAALNNRFDLLLDTNSSTVAASAVFVMAALEKGTWVKSRK